MPAAELGILSPDLDRDGAPLLLAEIIHRFPWLRHLFADGGYAGDKLKAALRRLGKWTIEIIKRTDAAKGFELLPRRWVVERTLAWLNRNRRLAKDFEQTIPRQPHGSSSPPSSSSSGALQGHQITRNNYESDSKARTA